MSVWWHVYGGVAEAGDLAGCHTTMIVGPTVTPWPAAADGAVPELHIAEGVALPWLAAFDHEPGDAELAEVTGVPADEAGEV